MAEPGRDDLTVARLNLCLLGCGAVARLHSRVARTLRSELALSYASRSPERAEAYNQRFKGVGAFGSYEAACAAQEVDAVFVCTPHALHVEHARLAASHGKPVLIEKPVTRTLDELTELEGLVERAGVMCMVAENYYFKPLVGVLRAHLEGGDVGDPLFVELNKTGRRRPQGWRADPEMMGGGALLEGGIHWVNLLHALGGPSRQVVAGRPRGTHPPTAPCEDNLQLLVHFESGAVGKLLHSWNTTNRVGGLQLSKIYGTAGNIFFESNGLWAVVAGRRKRLRIPGIVDIMGYRAMLRTFVQCVRNRLPPPMSLAVARRDLAFVFAAYRSLESGRFERVGG